jgi:PAS domain S-box-containing protein
VKRFLSPVLILLLCLVQAAPARADELRLYDAPKGQSASRSLTYWRDAGGQAGIEEARAADRAGQFQPANGRISFDIDKAPHWFRLDLKRPAGTPDMWWIELPHPGLDHVQLYVPGAAGYAKRYEVGDHQAFADRPIEHRHFIFPVTLPADQVVTLYFRVQTDDTLEVPLRVWNPQRFEAADNVRDMTLGLYYGVIFAMLVYNLFIFIKLRDSPYLYYLIFSLTMVAVIAEFNGQIFQYVFPGNLWWADRQHIVLPLLALCTTLLFGRSFLELKTALPWMDRVVLATIGIEILVGVIGLGFDYSMGQILIVLISPLVMLICLVAGVLRVRQGYRPAKYYVVAEIPLQICVTFTAMSVKGLVSTEVLMQQAVEVGAVLEVLLYSLALADRMAMIREEKQAVEARLEVHEKLAALERESRTILENTPDTVARYDRAGRRTYANPAFGAATEGGIAMLLGKKPSEFPGGPHAESYEAMVEQVFVTGKNAQFELKWPGKDGKQICSHIRLTPERDGSGAVTSVLAVGRDITEINEYQAELERKELAKSRFLAAAGHDLRQPLAAANLFVDALRFSKPTPQQAEIIQRLDQSMATFNGLLESLLNVSRLDAGVIKPEYAAVDAGEIFTWLEQNFAPLAGAKHLGFRLYFPLRKTLTVRTDAGLVKSVLMNLVSNAINYTPQGGILISVRRRGNHALFQVWDTGMGIPEEHIGQVFDEFYQVGNPQRDRSKGLGLGLSIAKRAMSLLGGEITCRSHPGRGTVFGFSLPLGEAPGGAARHAPASTAPVQAQDGSFARGKRFVVVEDDALVAQSLVGLLEGLGGEVMCFPSAEDALRHDGAEFADYIISDYMLGGEINGIQLLNRLRKKRGAPINSVLITGDTSHALLVETTDCAWTVLHKPVSLAALIASLRESESRFE